MSVLLIVVAMWTPFETAFIEPHLDELFFFNRIVDLSFVVDMVLQFFVSFPDPKRPTRYVKNPTLIVQRYLSSWFCVDLASMLPIDVYIVFSKRGSLEEFSGLRNLKVIRLLRLVRLLRLARFSTQVDRWQTSFGFTYASLALAKNFAAVVLCCHWIACLWGGVAVRAEGRSWLDALQQSKGGPEDLYEGPLKIYSISLYWAIISLTGIGYGDITPQTRSEYHLSIVCCSIMASMWAYVIGAVCGIVSTMEPHELNFKQAMDDLNWIMKEHAVPHDLCKKLRRYQIEAREVTRRRAEREVTEQMSPTLQGEFAHWVHRELVNKVWYLRPLSHEILAFVASRLQGSVYAPNEEVFLYRTLCIVQRGTFALGGRVLGCGDIWGDDMLLSNEVLRETQCVRSLNYSSVLRLHILDLVDVVNNFPPARVRLRWAQVRIAIQRGTQRIAKVSRTWDQEHGTPLRDMTHEQRMTLFTDILQGKVAFEDNKNHTSFLGIDADGRSLRTAGRTTTSMVTSSSIEASPPHVDLGSLTDHMLHLSMQLESLSQDCRRA